MLGLRSKRTFADRNITAQRLRTTCSSSRKNYSPSSRTGSPPPWLCQGGLVSIFVNNMFYFCSVHQGIPLFFYYIVHHKRQRILQHGYSGKKPSTHFVFSLKFPYMVRSRTRLARCTFQTNVNKKIEFFTTRYIFPFRKSTLSAQFSSDISLINQH